MAFELSSNIDYLYYDDLIYSDAVWLTSHNAFSNHHDGWNINAQQSLNITEQYDYGVRSFMIDTYYKDKSKNEIVLCHEDFKETYRKDGEYTKYIKRIFDEGCFATKYAQFLKEPVPLSIWLKTNLYPILKEKRNSIITLHLECYVMNTDIITLFNDSGLKQFMLTSKNPNDPSLSLGEMRISNQRLVVFSDCAYERYIHNMTTVPGIFNTREYYESLYNLDEDNQCGLRDDFRAIGNKKLFVLNHFFKTSFISSKYDEHNSYVSISTRVQACAQNSLFPNFIAVDHIERGAEGGAKSVVKDLNLLHQLESKERLLQQIEDEGKESQLYKSKKECEKGLHNLQDIRNTLEEEIKSFKQANGELKIEISNTQKNAKEPNEIKNIKPDSNIILNSFITAGGLTLSFIINYKLQQAIESIPGFPKRGLYINNLVYYKNFAVGALGIMSTYPLWQYAGKQDSE